MRALEGTGVPEVTFFARIEHKSKESDRNLGLNQN